MGLALVTPAATGPVTLATAKAYCSVEDSSFDTLLGVLLKAATEMVEGLTGLTLGAKTWALVLDGFADAIELPRGPVISIGADKFTYLGTDGGSHAISAANYTLDLVSSPQWVVRNEGYVWPEVLAGVNVVRIEFVAGYTEATLPAPIQLAILMLVANWFANREAANVGNIVNEMPFGVKQLLFPWTKFGF